MSNFVHFQDKMAHLFFLQKEMFLRLHSVAGLLINCIYRHVCPHENKKEDPEDLPGDQKGPWYSYESYYVLGNMMVSFLIPVVILMWLYLRIYQAAQRNSERTRRTSLGGVTHESIDPRNLSNRPPSR